MNPLARDRQRDGPPLMFWSAPRLVLPMRDDHRDAATRSARRRAAALAVAVRQATFWAKSVGEVHVRLRALVACRVAAAVIRPETDAARDGELCEYPSAATTLRITACENV